MKDILFSSWGGKIIDNRGKDLPDYEAVDHVELPEYFKQDVRSKHLSGGTVLFFDLRRLTSLIFAKHTWKLFLFIPKHATSAIIVRPVS